MAFPSICLIIVIITMLIMIMILLKVCCQFQDMATLLPALKILDPSLPAERQQCLLIASKEAKALNGRSRFIPQDDRLSDPKTAFEEGNILTLHLCYR